MFAFGKAQLRSTSEPPNRGQPSAGGSFVLLNGHVLVHVTGSGSLQFGATHPAGVEQLRAVIGDAV